MEAFEATLPYAIPICVGFLFLRMSCGLLMKSKGFSPVYPMLISFFTFASSMEFITVNLSPSAFSPLYAFFLTLMVNARHLFYGLSMLEEHKNVGWKKPYLIYGVCDESFVINYIVAPPPDIDKDWFMLFVIALNQIYWVCGVTLDVFPRCVIHFNTKGIEFVMITPFVVMLINQWEENKDHRPIYTRFSCTLACLLLFGSELFILPAMALVVLCFILTRKESEKEMI